MLELGQENEEKNPTYVNEAIILFRKIVSEKKKNAFENMSREHKGELFVLHFLSERNDDVFPSELSTALQSSAARISALLGSLEKKGQIERHIDKNNRRNVRVTITEEGRIREEEEMQKLSEGLAHVFVEMGEVDAAEFLRLLEQFFKLTHKHFEDFDNK